MEAWWPEMLQAFDNDGDQYSTQHHNHTKHDFPVMPDYDMWPVDAEGKPIDANPDHIYKFTNMKQKWAWNWHVLTLLNIYAFKQNSWTGDQELC